MGTTQSASPKFHVAKGCTPEQAGGLILPAAQADRNLERESGIRYFPHQNIWCTNFKGSPHLSDWIKTVEWSEHEGIDVGMIPGLYEATTDG